jgi:hypothetical protein
VSVGARWATDFFGKWAWGVNRWSGRFIMEVSGVRRGMMEWKSVNFLVSLWAGSD